MINLETSKSISTETCIQAQEPTKKTASHLPAIDGLRGLAAMMVVFYHCWNMHRSVPFPQFSLFGVTVPLYRVFTPGYTGVYLFFVLSGFCLAYPFFSNPERKDNWPAYAMNRVRRIWPPYVISFLILYAIGALLQYAQIYPAEEFLYEKFKWIKFVKALFLIRKSHICNSYWTLVLEWRWYLCFPALLIMARRIPPVFMVAAVCGVSYLSQYPFLAGRLQPFALGPLFGFLPMFALGIWAAHLAVSKSEALPLWERWLVNHSLLGVTVSALWCLAFCPPVKQITYTTTLAAWGPLYFFLILAVLNQPQFKQVFSSAPFVKLGVISYSIYLLQEPVICAGRIFIEMPGSGGFGLFCTRYLLMPVLCVLAGWAF